MPDTADTPPTKLEIGVRRAERPMIAHIPVLRFFLMSLHIKINALAL